jgi:hypothetical protein
MAYSRDPTVPKAKVSSQRLLWISTAAFKDNHGSGGRPLVVVVVQKLTTTGAPASAAHSGGSCVAWQLFLAPRGENEAAGDGHDDDDIVQAHPRHIHQVHGEDFVADDDAFAAVDSGLEGDPA